MVKKEFTKETPKRLNKLSDIELIEEMEGKIHVVGDMYRDIIRAILDKRLKTSIQDLTGKVEKLNRTTSFYSVLLLMMTDFLIILGVITIVTLPIINDLFFRVIIIAILAILIIIPIVLGIKEFK